MPDRPDIACIVVHHRSPDTVLTTIESVLGSGMSADNVHLIDNSGSDTGLQARLAEHGHHDVRTHHIANRGYGNAVNHGIALLRDNPPRTLLVLTHDVILRPGCLSDLHAAISDDVVAAGPTLSLRDDPAVVWSRGGITSRATGRPRHVLAASDTAVSTREWLDGACVLYAFDDLADHLFREEFVMYFEETELHWRMGSSGRVVHVESAHALQSTGGTPELLLVRNLRLYLRLRGRLLQSRLTPLLFGAVALRHGRSSSRRVRARQMLRLYRAAGRLECAEPGQSYPEAETVFAMLRG